MRRPKRTTSCAPRLHWMTPASPGDRSPMDILMSWLERNGEEYRQSKRKTQMVEQLCEEMAMNGIYGLSLASIRSQLCRLKSSVQMKAEGGNCNSLAVNRYYDRLLLLLFDDNERAQMRGRAATVPETEPKAPPVVTKAEAKAKKRGTEKTSLSSKTKKRGAEEISLPGTSFQSIEPILDTAEIRRRFELLSARQELQQRGVDRETIDSFLPLSHNFSVLYFVSAFENITARLTVMPRHGPSFRSHLSWLEPASPDALSPMQLLVIWLSRHYARYSNSNTKGEMIHELCQGMRDAGYPSCTVHAIRSKIDSLRREARRTGDHRHSLAFQQYQQSLTTIFAAEGQHEDRSNTEDQENTTATSDTPSSKAKTLIEVTAHGRLMNAPIRIPDEETLGTRRHRAPPPNCVLDVTEIRRRFELLCARHALAEEGVAMEVIDRMLPLP